MKNNVKILSLKKNEIIYKINTKKDNHLYYATLCIIALFICFSLTSIDFKNLIYIFNPVNSLYNDNSKVVFTAGQVIDDNTYCYNLPIKTKNFYISTDGDIDFLVNDSIMVIACEDGFVEEIEDNKGSKTIIIKHSEDIYTILKNVHIVSVKEGSIVKKGQNIGIGKINEKIRLNIFKNDKKIVNLKILKSNILWKVQE